MAGCRNVMSGRIKSEVKDLSEPSAGNLLNALAPLLRVRPALEDHCKFGGAWRSPHGPAGTGRAPFHIVTRGACVIERRGAEAIELGAGDALLLPHGDSHIVRGLLEGTPGTDLVRLDLLLIEDFAQRGSDRALHSLRALLPVSLGESSAAALR